MTYLFLSAFSLLSSFDSVSIFRNCLPTLEFDLDFFYFKLAGLASG